MKLPNGKRVLKMRPMENQLARKSRLMMSELQHGVQARTIQGNWCKKKRAVEGEFCGNNSCSSYAQKLVVSNTPQHASFLLCFQSCLQLCKFVCDLPSLLIGKSVGLLVG